MSAAAKHRGLPERVTSARDPRVVRLRALQRDAASRDAAGLAVVDDEALLLAALDAGCAVELALADADAVDAPVAGWRAALPAPPVPASSDALRALGALGRRPRVVAAVRRPPATPEPAAGLALAGVRDAGNVGAIVRTAAALRLPAVTLLPGCGDPWGRKALRAAQGATFAPGLVRRADDVAALRGSGPVLAAVPRGGADPATLDGAATVLLGAEDAGLGTALVAACDGAVTIAADGFESLGVAAAAAILADALARARRAAGLRPPAGPRPGGRRA
ncbi:TrmH family RNA methyltransferase [Patulibacter brassicae]|uniref:TrmH family RNA methyltransferase n=1 Tax=Patulibacter brassicae TaxID=1705717 RepID=A0ABU4VS19_9ACTN|nr:TrmH family RNA methyltransferase [Patulibacter brassicae]MDX8153590.1 TrmH family RNA methyltransferase [Patulibacter brassicae]